MTWDQLDWGILDRLRDRFLQGSVTGPYWQSDDDLAHYDATYAERIGWKWDAVLGELRRRGWQPQAGAVLDWGCGSGVAGRRVATAWPAQVTALSCWDHSPRAREFAARRAREARPDLPATAVDDAAQAPPGTLVLSHVLNELDPLGRGALAEAIERAQTVLWVEPGTSTVAKDLVQWREKYRKTFRFVLPCPHQGQCGLLMPGNERHWCHHFAAPPSSIFADSNWVRFGQRAGIDLRSLPYSVLVMERINAPETAPLPPGASRILGRPEQFKPYARFLNCDVTGVQELTLPKRVDPVVYRRLERADAPRLWQWQREGGTIRQAEPL